MPFAEEGCRNIPELDRDALLDACSLAWCDPTTGEWLKEPIPSDCAKFYMCSQGFVKADGKCDWKAFDCDDGNACTVDTCTAATCHHKLAPACEP